jgi:hypothetical protein
MPYGKVGDEKGPPGPVSYSLANIPSMQCAQSFSCT